MVKKNSKNNKIFWIFVIAFLVVILIPFLYKDKTLRQGLQFYIKEPSASILSYEDIVRLTKPISISNPIYLKLQKQLDTPHIVNKSFFPLPSSSLSHNYLRIAQWNIERGFNINLIKTIFSDRNDFFYSYRKNVPDEKGFANELNTLKNSDIICLNEADIGMPRTDYKNTVSEIASAIKYNYVFATEFLELNPVIFNTDVDKKRFLGLHGNAILSKYPIKSARILRLPECYKWYEEEMQKKSPLEHVRRVGAQHIFNEEIVHSEVRRGGRNALIVTIELPNKEIITVVSTHLEDKCFPDKRFKQFEYLLSNLKSIRNPVIITGDFNTTTTDSAPVSVKKEFIKRIRDPHYIARQAILALIPIGPPGVANLTSLGLSKLIQYKDPTAPSIPIILPNQERKFFNYLKDFRFSDGETFDISGDRSSNGKNGLLASSNERDVKGFESTFKFAEPRAIAYFKLDWFFIKPKGNRFRPYNGQTLQLINNAYPNRVSDHDPIVVDLNL